MSYEAFLVAFLGVPRDHHSIFIQTDETEGTGYLFHVVGTIQTGMEYEAKEYKNPESSASFMSKTSIGWGGRQ